MDERLTGHYYNSPLLSQDKFNNYFKRTKMSYPDHNVVSVGHYILIHTNSHTMIPYHREREGNSRITIYRQDE